MMFQFRASVEDGGTTLNQRCVVAMYILNSTFDN